MKPIVTGQSTVSTVTKAETSIKDTSADVDVVPYINSEDEYDSDDSAGPPSKPGFVVPEWAKSPHLRQALRSQVGRDPDSIFGAITPLNLEDIFTGSSIKRFRVRGSSANWTHDKLTQMEINSYQRVMGYQQPNP
jgi:hypothetical protein